ncbi:sigma-54-dependent Fis family transcriptional regulator [Roseospira visakhapatnamensis]|uniref:Transcriptional regulator of acetoin/glycerol metabolism n=1 Tax=Roseospira visakhapatnamensis TaxID=390880 RepID=A0A7W6RA24_9PROT|nr:sigma-54-dependent Fis family transcriptional regulator [Roseospira visakhapatnamensis]MBB4264522.1 transcriptional regulator of acetoin/glycerol metabolism [Roseospira visakhapatnamensis]
MAGTPYSRAVGPGGDTTTMAAWEKFLSGEGMPTDAVRRTVEDSWRRCQSLGVDPVRRSAPVMVAEDALDALKDRHRDLVQAARPVMAQARQFLAESRTVMVLTDPEGVILWVEGDPQAKARSHDIRLVPGAAWHESVSGTNAIGTALAAGQPVRIVAAEHFCEGIKRWTCSATVIHDPDDGRIVGVLDISGLKGSHNTHCLALAVTGASRIEARLAAVHGERRARLLDVALTRTRQWADQGVMIFDHRGRMVRANHRAEAYLNGLGLDLGACNDVALPGPWPDNAPPDTPLPPWLKRDWLEPVMERAEHLGTLLAIPASRPGHRSPAVAEAVPPGTEDADPFAAIVGTSAVLAAVKTKARRLARLPVPVLLLGPTGAGKEVFARALHAAGPRGTGPFVPLNCAAMTRDLLASELFGYGDGAFTGARRGGMGGKFEAADGGTLFLDEIGEMPPDLQAHFLRVLEDGVVYRLGEHKPRRIKVRVVAATNRDLRADVAAGAFRMDLFYRLAVTVLHLPRLADRVEDIPILVRHFIDQTRRAYGVAAKRPSADLIAALQAHPWPGNVRELRNVVEGLMLLVEGEGVTRDDLPPDYAEAPAPRSARIGTGPPEGGGDDDRDADTGPGHRPAPAAGDPVSLADRERETMVDAIAHERGNLTRAATRLGIAKSTLYEKMKRHRVDRVSALQARPARSRHGGR